MTSVKPGPCENNAREAIEKHDTPPKGNNPKAGEEFTDAIDDNVKAADREKLAPVVAAIRHAENGSNGPPPAGRPHEEYGILHDKTTHPNCSRCPGHAPDTYRGQAGWCAATVQKNYDRYKNAGGDPNDMKAYLKFLGARYCPVDADNDRPCELDPCPSGIPQPHGINAHWLGNVSKYHKRIIDKGNCN